MPCMWQNKLLLLLLGQKHKCICMCTTLSLVSLWRGPQLPRVSFLLISQFLLDQGREIDDELSDAEKRDGNSHHCETSHAQSPHYSFSSILNPSQQRTNIIIIPGNLSRLSDDTTSSNYSRSLYSLFSSYS